MVGLEWEVWKKEFLSDVFCFSLRRVEFIAEKGDWLVESPKEREVSK